MKIHDPTCNSRAYFRTVKATKVESQPIPAPMIENSKSHNMPPSLPRLVPRHPGKAMVAVAVGRRRLLLEDMYVRLIDAQWKKLMALIAVAYCSLNTVFATLYLLKPGSILNAAYDSFADAFFFSVQTLATIGYGQMAPHGFYANVLVTIEAFLGFAFYAMITGLVFAKFSRPTARVMFSNNAVICPYQGAPHLMLRLANERLNRIVNASLQAVLLIEEKSDEGHRMRRFVDVPLVRGQVPFMLLTWTVMHKIDRDSPFFGMTTQALRDRSAELIVSLTGLDESLAQTIHARFSYLTDEVVFNHVFDDIISRGPDGRVEIHYEKFHDTHPYRRLDAVNEPASPEDIPADQLPVEQPTAPAVPVTNIAANANSAESAPMARAEDDPAFAEFVKMCSPD
jgi:inward rectifier potassium channel